jgi:hypothetical protein
MLADVSNFYVCHLYFLRLKTRSYALVRALMRRGRPGKSALGWPAHDRRTAEVTTKPATSALSRIKAEHLVRISGSCRSGSPRQGFRACVRLEASSPDGRSSTSSGRRRHEVLACGRARHLSRGDWHLCSRPAQEANMISSSAPFD